MQQLKCITPKANQNCGICLQQFLKSSDAFGHTAGKIHHLFHAHCLEDWLNTNSSLPCPTCRIPIHFDFQPLSALDSLLSQYHQNGCALIDAVGNRNSEKVQKFASQPMEHDSRIEALHLAIEDDQLETVQVIAQSTLLTPLEFFYAIQKASTSEKLEIAKFLRNLEEQSLQTR